MPEKDILIATHGGAGSNSKHTDGAESAAQQGVASLRSSHSVLDAACRAVASLEDDSRFNAGIGSQRRSDGSVRMDAACMDSQHRFGAVAVLEGFKNPIYIAKGLCDTPYRVLAGPGAAQFAREQGFPALDPQELRHPTSLKKSSDTVGCVVFDGNTFAAALSTGGTKGTYPGRVGDVPLIGCGLYAGENGAVAATGNGEAITMQLTAYQAYLLLEQGAGPDDVLQAILKRFDEQTDIGLILVSREGTAGGSNRDMAWFAGEYVVDF